jgi:hypothetical protein
MPRPASTTRSHAVTPPPPSNKTTPRQRQHQHLQYLELRSAAFLLLFGAYLWPESRHCGGRISPAVRCTPRALGCLPWPGPTTDVRAAGSITNLYRFTGPAMAIAPPAGNLALCFVERRRLRGETRASVPWTWTVFTRVVGNQGTGIASPTRLLSRREVDRLCLRYA